MELNLKFTDFKTFEEGQEIQKNLEGKNSAGKSFLGTNNPVKMTPGIYVLTPFKIPYYVGLSTVRGKKYWILERVIQHIKNIKRNSCTYVIFKSNVYQTAFPGRDAMIPRLAKPTKPIANFFPFAKTHVLFWREKGLGFLSSSVLINPKDPMLPVSNVKNPLRSQITQVVNTVFSSPNFSFFYLEIPQIIGLANEKDILKCLETIVKFSLKTNTVSDSLMINSITGKLKSFGISKITISCPNVTIKNLFYPFPHDDDHNPVSALRGVVNII